MKIEGVNVAAIDVAYHLDELRNSIKSRKEDKYLHPTIENEKNELSDRFDEEMIDDVLAQFSGIILITFSCSCFLVVLILRLISPFFRFIR